MFNAIKMNSCTYRKTANIHAISFNKIRNNNNLNDDSINITYRMIINEYPAFNPDRGDIIENIDECGYRSGGVYFYDGEKIITQYYDYDAYGTPPYNFKICTEFYPGYWDYGYNDDRLKRINYENQEYDHPYWHSGSSTFTTMEYDLLKNQLINQSKYHIKYSNWEQDVYGVLIESKFGSFLIISEDFNNIYIDNENNISVSLIKDENINDFTISPIVDYPILTTDASLIG